MKFGRWYALDEAAASAPASPGVYQLRLREGLIDYPTGKSAMVHYGSSDNVRAALIELAETLDPRDLLARHTIEMSAREAADPAAAAQSVIESFERRFGSVPRVPA